MLITRLSLIRKHSEGRKISTHAVTALDNNDVLLAQTSIRSGSDSDGGLVNEEGKYN